MKLSHMEKFLARVANQNKQLRRVKQMSYVKDFKTEKRKRILEREIFPDLRGQDIDIEQGLKDALENGLVSISGYGDDGEPLFQLTEAGKTSAESMIDNWHKR